MELHGPGLRCGLAVWAMMGHAPCAICAADLLKP